MAKRLFFLLALFTVISPSAMHGGTIQLPPLPQESSITPNINMVILKEPISDQKIKEMLSPYPDLELRHVFQHALNGFSVKGRMDSLEKLKEINEILFVSPVQSYSVNTANGVKMIGSEELRSFFDEKGRRITGKGVTVGVIDTGIDYNHPDLRRSYAGGHDLVDGDRDPMETESPAGEPTYHGSHVAGIIAANGKIKGVAPDAKIIAYRALGPGGSGTTEQVLAAIEQAVKDRVDIVNLSLGNSINGPDLPISLALNNVVDKGIVAVTSSGNSGPEKWTVGSPGTASKAISVGASTPVLNIPFLLIEGSRENIRLEPMSLSGNWKFDRSLDLVDGGTGSREEIEKVNPRNKLILVKRGKNTFTEKARIAMNAGAKGIIIFNNTKGRFYGNLEEDLPFPVASISKEAGESLKQKLKVRENSVRLQLIEESDRLADFSSRGPVTSTWEIKPDILAPGVEISSTVPGGYMPLQGTSMAAPHVAGVCALLKQAHPDWNPAQMKAAIMNTAMPLKREGEQLYRTFEQGAGRVRAKEALQTKSLVYPASIQLGKFQLADRKHRHKAYVTVENISLSTIRYSFSSPSSTKGLTWHLPMPFTLAPKEKREIQIELSVEPKLFKGKIHDGYLNINAGSDSIAIPYLYVLEEPDYPRVMGFELAQGDKPGTYRYEVYLPGGAEEFGIALFEKEHMRFVGFLDTGRNLPKGMYKKEVSREQLPAPGNYLLKTFARKTGKIDMVDMEIQIEE